MNERVHLLYAEMCIISGARFLYDLFICFHTIVILFACVSTFL